MKDGCLEWIQTVAVSETLATSQNGCIGRTGLEPSRLDAITPDITWPLRSD